MSPAINLRPATSADLDLLQSWDEQPHVIASDPNDDWHWDIELDRTPDWREQLIAEIDGRAIGFLQIIDPAREESHYWGDVANNLRAIDIWIGAETDLGKGYGTEMMQLALARCFADPSVTAVLLDPLVSNTRVHRFYERLGFEVVERRQFGDDDCLVYRLDRADWHPPMDFMGHVIAPPERQASLRLQDGRKLAWSEWGPPDGLPILFCTGAAMSGSLGFGTDSLWELGLRLLTIDRPGLGQSEADPSKTLLSWVADVQEWIQHNGLRHISAVGFSQGAPFAYALGAKGVVEAIAIVSGQDELTHPSIQPLLHPNVAHMIAAVEQDAGAFEQHFAQTVTWEGLWQLIMTMSGESDRALYLSDAFSQAYQRCLREGFSQGAGGYARDLVNAVSAWPFALEEITIPVDLWYGGLDTSPVHSPDFGATLATRLPQADHILEPDAGSAILWTRSREILAKLKSHVADSIADHQPLLPHQSANSSPKNHA